LSLRGSLIIAGVAVAALTASHAGAYRMGAASVERRHAAEEAQATIDGVRINLDSWRTANAQTEELNAEIRRLTQEASYGRRAIASIDTPPPPGRVGRTALVDPAIGRPFVRTIECVHQHSDDCRGAAAGADE